MSEQLIATPGIFGENKNFLLERELGSGGMGGVYMGRDKMLDRQVAVKVMLKEYGNDADFVEKFKREAQAAAKLIHPNIAQIYSYGICDGMPYIAMELASGGSLYSIMNANSGKTDVARVMKICQQVAQALQCASDQGFVHGDVKPENILLDANGNAKLVDFGLAAMQKDTSEIWGTPYYISPEKVKKEVVDFRADMYSLGGTLYHALTGVAPFEGADPIAVVKKRFEETPKKPSEIRPELTPAIDALIMKMLARNKEDRFPSFEALLKEFNEVLTNGLTKSESVDKKPATSGTKKTSLSTRRMTTVRGVRRMSTVKRPIKKIEEDPDIDGQKDEDEEDEESGGVGAKVALFVIGGILAIGALVGGLVWFKMASDAADRAETARQIQDGYDKATKAVADTVEKAMAFADEFDTFSAKAVKACQEHTDQLKKLLPDFAEQMQPPPTKELLDAIALTNVTAEVAKPEGTNAPPQQAAAATNAAEKVVVKEAPKGPKLPQFRPPNDDEKDPASPEGEAYLKAKKEFEAEQLKKLKEKPAKQVEAEAKAEEGGDAQSDDKEKKKETPQVIITMHELWERTYGCQACAIKIRAKCLDIRKKANDADALKEVTRENMDKMADLSRTLVDMLEQVKTSKDVENVRKGITFIKSKGEKAVTDTVKRLRIEKLERERKEKKEAAEAAEKARLEKLAAEKKAKIEAECAEASQKFDTIAAQGSFRQLDWKGAIRQIEMMKGNFTTAEGQLAADLQLKRVAAMKQVQDIFMSKMKGYVFKAKKLRGCNVLAITERDILVVKPDGKNKQKILWQKFYKDYPGNFNELINTYIVNGRKNAGLNLKDWSNAMLGASLTMRLVCPEVNGAMEKSEKLAKEVIKQYSEYEKTVKEMLPDVKFEDEAAAEETKTEEKTGEESKDGEKKDDEKKSEE